MFSQLHMPARLTIQTIALALIACLITVLFTSQPVVAEDAHAKSFSVTAEAFAAPGEPHIIVTSNDGTRWDRIEETTLSVTYKANLNLRWPGYVERVALYAGQCPRNDCNGHKVLFRKNNVITRDYKKTVNIPLKSTDLVPVIVVGDGILAQHPASEVLDACKLRLLPNAEAKSEPFEFIMRVNLLVNTRKQANLNKVETEAYTDDEAIRTGDQSKSTDLKLRVVCKPFGVQDRPAPPPSLISSFTLTRVGSTKACPKPFRLDVRFRFPRKPGEQKRRVYFKISANDKQGPMISRSMTPHSNHFTAHYQETIKLDPGQQKVFLITYPGGRKKPGAYKEITHQVNCPPMQVNLVTLNYVQIQDALCPKRVWETTKFYTTRPDPVRYEIKQQSGLVAASGTIDAKRHDDQYIAVVQRLLMLNAVDTDMMARTTDGTNANSGWTKLKVNCMDVLSSKLDILKLDNRKCPKKAFVRATYEISQLGGIRDFLRCSDGSEETGVINATEEAGKFIARRTMTVDIDKTTTLKCSARAQDFRAKTVVFAQKYFKCGDAGASDDLAVQPDPVEPPPPARKLVGDFQFVDRDNRKRCPRQVKAVINFEHGSNVGVRYALECTTGTYNGLAPSRKVNGGYVAPAVESIRIPKGTNGKSHVNCALKSISPGKRKLHIAKGRKFTCINPTTEPVGGLDSAGTPPVAVTEISCKRGKVRNGKCRCGSRRKLKKLGRKQFACVKTAQKISCKRGKVRNGKCTCGSRRVLKRLANRRFACVKKARTTLRQVPRAKKRSQRQRNKKRRNQNPL